MSPPRKYFALVLAAGVVAAGGFVWLNIWEADRAMEVAKAENETRAARGRGANPPTQSLIAVPTPNPAPALPPMAGRDARGSRSATAEQLRQWLAAANNPAVMHAAMAHARTLTLQRYADFLGQLPWTAEQREELAKLLDDKRQAAMDLAVASYQNGLDPRDDLDAFEAQVAAAKAGIEKEIRAMLGAEGYAQYEAYGRDQGVISTFVRLQTIVDGTADAFTADQTARLHALLDVPGSGLLSPSKLGAAQAFLSPGQMAALQQVFADQRNVPHERNLQALPPTVERK